MHMRCHDFEDDDNERVFVFVFSLVPVPECYGNFEDDDMEEYLIITDTMVCTGCCATLDHIVTYLFKKVTNKGESKGSANFDRNVELCCLQLERKCADLKLLLKMTLLWL